MTLIPHTLFTYAFYRYLFIQIRSISACASWYGGTFLEPFVLFLDNDEFNVIIIMLSRFY